LAISCREQQAESGTPQPETDAISSPRRRSSATSGQYPLLLRLGLSPFCSPKLERIHFYCYGRSSLSSVLSSGCGRTWYLSEPSSTSVNTPLRSLAGVALGGASSSTCLSPGMSPAFRCRSRCCRRLLPQSTWYHTDFWVRISKALHFPSFLTHVSAPWVIQLVVTSRTGVSRHLTGKRKSD
jgi:hypothetical protein